MHARSMYTVVKVIDERQVCIDVGLDAPLNIGDRVNIVRLGDSVFHPVSGEDLGQIENVVGSGFVQHIQDNMTVLSKAKPTDREPFLILDQLQGPARGGFRGVDPGDQAVVYHDSV